MQIIHGLIFGKQSLVFRGASKNFMSMNMIMGILAIWQKSEQNLIILWQKVYA